ncbi:VOC family protein [Tolypothrix campylonemoides VB511288]|nr:VOC family protein [Tolypothrix campylonemoides VB511288]
MAVHELFPYLCVADARAAIAFYRHVFDAVETLRLVEPGGRIGHAEVKIGDATLMLCEPFPEFGVRPPSAGAGHDVTLHLHVDDADAVLAHALDAGATLAMPARDQFYGERSGVFVDPFGHRWNVGHSIEHVDAEEMQRRYTALCTDAQPQRPSTSTTAA